MEISFPNTKLGLAFPLSMSFFSVSAWRWGVTAPVLTDSPFPHSVPQGRSKIPCFVAAVGAPVTLY